MARPMRDGIEYFSFDTDFFADDKVKLIRSEFGAKGIVVLIYLFCEIYRGEGYYKVWDDDSCILVSDGAACGCTPDFTSQVVQRCVKRSLFDDKLFNVHGILTSPGIQRRYLRACATRDEIRIRKEYWLLDAGNKKDVPVGILKKVTFTDETLQNNPVSLQRNPVNLQINPQSKGKESKGKQSIERGFAPPTLDEVKEYCRGKRIDPERFFNYYEGNGWVTSSGRPIANWKAIASNWERREKASGHDRPPSYDLEAWENLSLEDQVGQEEKS